MTWTAGRPVRGRRTRRRCRGRSPRAGPRSAGPPASSHPATARLMASAPWLPPVTSTTGRVPSRPNRAERLRPSLRRRRGDRDCRCRTPRSARPKRSSAAPREGRGRRGAPAGSAAGWRARDRRSAPGLRSGRRAALPHQTTGRRGVAAGPEDGDRPLLVEHPADLAQQPARDERPADVSPPGAPVDRLGRQQVEAEIAGREACAPPPRAPRRPGPARRPAHARRASARSRARASDGRRCRRRRSGCARDRAERPLTSRRRGPSPLVRARRLAALR